MLIEIGTYNPVTDHFVFDKFEIESQVIFPHDLLGDLLHHLYNIAAPDLEITAVRVLEPYQKDVLL